ncbi:tRNA synthetases class I (M)-domain-containing protein [Sporodiniella umbellata]|nr:tRNA synthetases class I (M)-domain-containing protein [Sporodiniella umbellata]
MRFFSAYRKTYPVWSTLNKRNSHTKAFVTTPIYYVNAVPHIGHLYSTVLADTIRRHYILRGKEAIMCTGTDEHGLKIQQAAEKNQMAPIDFCNKVSGSFKDLCEAANVEYTSFQRTTNEEHKIAVRALWKQLLEKGYIYKGKHEGWYAVSDEAFYTASQVHEVTDEKTGEKVMVAIESGQRVEWTSEKNYKFRLSAFREKILDWIRENPDAIVPAGRKNEVVSYLQGEVPDLSVSRLRDRLHWGIQVPDDTEHTIYVWLDALTNYLTATGYPWASKRSLKDAFPPDVQVVGKDIIRFHAIYWPAFLMAAGLPLPKQLLVHAHWTMEKQKMSKSKGNVADPFEVMKEYGVDAVRYYLVRNGGIENDSDYSEEMINRLYSKDLVGQLGNLFSRASSESLLPERKVPLKSKAGEGDDVLDEVISTTAERFDRAIEEREFSRAFTVVFDMLAEANRHFSANEPWKLAKKAEEKERLDTVLWYSLEACRVAGILLQPAMPSKMNQFLNDLGVSSEERYLEHAKQMTKMERALGPKAEVIFPRRQESKK